MKLTGTYDFTTINQVANNMGVELVITVELVTRLIHWSAYYRGWNWNGATMGCLECNAINELYDWVYMVDHLNEYLP